MLKIAGGIIIAYLVLKFTMSIVSTTAIVLLLLLLFYRFM